MWRGGAIVDSNQLTDQIGRTLRALRRERDWTLAQLAEATGVSKPMLGQIERGESNPTVYTLWKIAGGLDVPFSLFLGVADTPATVVRKSEHPVVYDEEGRYVVQNIVSVRNPRPTEMFYSRVRAGSAHVAQTHGSNVTEGIWLQSGTLNLELGEQTYCLSEGDSVHFVADIGHTYRNQDELDCTFIVLLVYG